MAKKFSIFSWALYDLANQFFAVNVVSLYFPRWITVEKGMPEISYSITFGVSMVLVAICAPFLGIISDLKNKRKVFLIIFTIISIVFTAVLGLTGAVFAALLFFIFANFGCQEAVIFYNALLPDVAPKERIGFISGLGRMFGYCGAILALYITKPVVLKMGYQAAFLLTALFFLVFALPCMIFVKESRRPSSEFSIKESLSATISRTKELCKVKGFINFLLVSLFMVSAVSTIMLFMAVYAGKVFGLGESGIIDLIIFSTFFAVFGSILFGYISDRIGYMRAFFFVIVLWGICILAAGTLSKPFHWAVGALGGFVLGSTWVVLRALVIRLIPKESIGGAFALFNLVGYLGGIVGPIFWGVILLCLARFNALGYRIAMLSMLLFIGISAFFFIKMKKEVQGNAELAGKI